MARLRVVIGDASRPMLVFMELLLEPHFEIVASVTDGEALLLAAQSTKPELIILDFSLLFLDGLAVAKRLRIELPRAKIVFFTTHEDPVYAEAAFAVGASGYLVKQRTDDLLHFLIRIVNGELIQHPERMERPESAPSNECLSPSR